MSSAVPALEEAGRVGALADDGTRRRDSIALFVGLTLAYILLRSPSYIGDAMRWLPLEVAPEFPSDASGARHYFFVWFAWLVYHAGAALGLVNEASPLRTSAIAIVQGVNAILSAGAVVVMYRFLRLSASRRAALTGVAFVACSSAYVLHSTNATEPVPSLVPALLGLYLVARTPERRSTRLLAAVLQGVATSFYLVSSVFTLPTAWFAFTRGAGTSGSVPLAKRVRVAAEHLVPAGLIYGTLVFVSELLIHPERGVAVAAHQPVNFELYGIYGGFQLRSLIGAFFGFANSLYPFPANQGMSRLFHLPPRSMATILAVSALGISFLGLLVWRLFGARQRLLANGRWVEATAGALWFLAVYGVAFYFLAGYDKTWLFAAFPVALLVSVVVDDALAFSSEAQAERRGVARLWFLVPGLLLLAANVGLVVIPRRLARNLDLEAALAVAERVKPHDLVVCRGWDNPSGYMRYVLKRPVDNVALADDSLRLGRSTERFTNHLESKVASTKAQGGRLYFLGVLDDSPDTWALFFAKDLNIPYELFEPYRRGAKQLDDPKLEEAGVKLFEFPLGR
ncbi:MAG TPA: hypothetical protein VNN72_23080 [Polyangiaceae bacterium]|nr:hypothetical protein [Polyangiaceae bacterium]